MPDSKRYIVAVTAHSTYLPDQSDEEDDRYVFAYTIRITNTGTVTAQVVSRHWIITDADNQVQEVRGMGVVGEQPVLKPGDTFEYSSGSSIPTAVGIAYAISDHTAGSMNDVHSVPLRRDDVTVSRTR